MTWQCDSDIFPKETGDRLTKKQATKRNQDRPGPPFESLYFRSERPEKLSRLSTNARPIVAQCPSNGGKFSRHLPTSRDCHIAVVCCVSCLCFVLFFSFFPSPYLSFKTYKWNIRGILLFHLGHALVWENGNNFGPTTDWWNNLKR